VHFVGINQGQGDGGMKIGTVTEIKRHEYRVGLTPSCVKAYVAHGHKVLVQKGAGVGAGFEDEQYRAAGAKIVNSRKDVFGEADMIVKVKEPQPEELKLLRKGQILYTYLHLAADAALTKALLTRSVKGMAYETIELEDGTLPCLKPMSEIAGRLSIQEGAKYLEKPFGGRGVLLGGVPGVPPGKVTIIGGGVVGKNACKIALGMGAETTIMDISSARLEHLDDIFGMRVKTLYSNEANVEQAIAGSDLVIGAVLIPGAKAPHVIRAEHLKSMKKGAVIVDVAVDQGGCAETTRPTTHDDPIYVVDGVIHYCVANMPGSVALTSTLALTSTTLRYGLTIADQGFEHAVRNSKPLAKGMNTYAGRCTCKGVAAAFGMEYAGLEILE
jgi:alanine dehydrogenase